jgi:ribonuclease HI
MGLEALIAMGKRRIRVHSDSELLVRQLNGQYRVRDPKLRILFERARSLLRRFDRHTIVHVGREKNKLADKLANRGIDEALKKRRHAG